MIKFNKLIAAGSVLGILAAGIGGAQAAVLLSEGFDDITTLAGSGWVTINNSAPAGNDWFQGNDGIFISQSGAINSYIANDFNSTAEISGVIDAWLIGPELSLPGGGMLTFFTQTADPGFSDKLEIRFIPVGEMQTRVELEHRNMDRYADQAVAMREALDSPQGWITHLTLFAREAARV